MPLPGGASDKVGLRYESLWAAYCLVKVMVGEYGSIRFEPPGDEGAGVEFFVNTQSGREYHQVKRQQTGRGRWSLSSLGTLGVLSDFSDKLHDPSVRCVFISTEAASELRELGERACSSKSWVEFESQFVSSDFWSDQFSQLNRHWVAADERETYARLQRIEIRTWDEKSLRESVETRLGALIDGNPQNATDVLMNLGLERIHHELNSEEIWEHLESRDFPKRALADDANLNNTLVGLRNVYVEGLDRVGIGGEFVERSQVKEVLEIFDGDDECDVVLLSGKAGVGKSSVVSQILNEIEGRDWPVVCLRVDRLKPCQTPNSVGTQLELPDSPVRVLASIAEGRDCLLILDQLDAVSIASGRNPEFFDCIAAMIAEAEHHPNMRVLAACRDFDIDNDRRIRDLSSEQGVATRVKVGEFDHDTVKRIVDELGFDSTKLSTKQLTLFSLPVHLKLLSELASPKPSAAEIQNPKELFEHFWDHKLDMLQARGFAAQDVHMAVNEIVDDMNARELLFASTHVVRKCREVVNALVSENVLVKDGTKLAFFHESFFDFMFARATVDRDFDLLDHLKTRDQSLFTRSQVRQILVHQRDFHRPMAVANLKSVLLEDDIRTHLKCHVLDLIGSFDDPTPTEWQIVESVLTTDLAQRVWSAIHGSIAWFDLLDSQGTVANWLAIDDEELVNRMFWLLEGVHKERPARCADLLNPYLGSSSAWNLRIRRFLVLAELSAERRLFELALRATDSEILDTTVRDSNQDGYGWHFIDELADVRPEWACELLAKFFVRLSAIADRNDLADPFSAFEGRADYSGDILKGVVEKAPFEFVDECAPFLFDVLQRCSDADEPQPRSDDVWGYHLLNDAYDLKGKFLEATENALCSIAATRPGTIGALIDQWPFDQYQTSQRLMLKSFATNGEYFADEAIEYMVCNPSSFETGYADSPYWIARETIAAATAHCSRENLTRLENEILAYYPLFEHTYEGLASRGRAQLTLLEGISEAQLSDATLDRLKQLRRKFKDELPSEPQVIEGGWVGSPIPESATGRMNDEDWLGAMAVYSTYRNQTDPMKGGAVELSRTLRTQTKEDPIRFAKLVARMPLDTNPTYFEAILEGLTGTDLDLDSVVAVCERLHSIPTRPLGRFISRPLERWAKFELPKQALEMVAWYATQATEPFPEIGGVDLLTSGINTVRGGAAITMARLIFDRPDNLIYFEPHLHEMVRHESAGVRTCVANTLLAVLRRDRDLAVDLFLKLCKADDELLSTRYVELFIKYAAHTHYEELEPLLERMITSEIEATVNVGARQICLASLNVESATALAQRCFDGGDALRIGAAEVYAANLKNALFRTLCKDSLVVFFNDTNPDVRSAAFTCFDHLGGMHTREYEPLVYRFLESSPRQNEFRQVFRMLTESTGNDPVLLMTICASYLKLVGNEINDIGTSASLHSRDVIKLVLMAYRQSNDRKIRGLCLDLIDYMSRLGAFGIDAALNEFER